MLVPNFSRRIKMFETQLMRPHKVNNHCFRTYVLQISIFQCLMMAVLAETCCIGSKILN